MKSIKLILPFLFFTSCFFKSDVKTIKGVYKIENRVYHFNNDSSIVEGYLFDRFSGHPLDYGTIHIKDKDIGTIPDSNGYFRLIIVEGAYSIVATSIGQTKLETKNINIKKNEKISIKINLGTHIID